MTLFRLTTVGLALIVMSLIELTQQLIRRPGITQRRRLLFWSTASTTSTSITTHSSSTKATKWKPVDCASLLNRARLGQVFDPNHNELFARWTLTNPPFYMALHTFDFDRLRRTVYTEGMYYEKVLTDMFGLVLKDAPPNSRVMDVGGNIGWFTMLSAAHGHHVDVFEPNPVNILRQCESSLLLNQWENAEQSDVLNRTKKKGSINIYPYGVGANVTAKTLFIGRNPGQASFEGRRIPKWRDPVKKNIAVITLDNMADELEWVHRKMPIAILKVDVEGFEPFVFAGATNLLKSGLVQNIFMELTANDAELSLNLDMIQTLLDAGYQVCRYGGMGGPTTTFNYTEIPLDASFAQKLIQKFVPDGKAQVNLWWALQKTTQLCS